METDNHMQVDILAKRIAKEDYDFVGLQEVNQLMDSPLAELDEYFQPTVEQQAIRQDNFLFCLVKCLKDLGCNYYWSWSYNHIGYDIYHEGIGLLSKTPIESESHLISESSDPTDYHTRKVMISTTTINGQKTFVASAHFSWWQNEKKAFAYEWSIIEKILLEKQGSLIMMGDFNNEAKRIGEGYDLVKNSSLGLHDAFVLAKDRYGENTVEKEIDGWSGNDAKLRIDYILVSDNYEVKSYHIVFDGNNESIISDHFGIEVEMD